jgi:photosystem II stability/assembly factor-like uncharacterized protein
MSIVKPAKSRKAAGLLLFVCLLLGTAWLSHESKSAKTEAAAGRQGAGSGKIQRSALPIHGKLRGMQRKVNSIEWFVSQRAYPDGIPLDAESKAVEYVQKRMIPELRQRQLAKNSASTLLGQTIAWTSRGPGNIGGRTRGLAVDPSNGNVIYAGSVSGGVWKTTNGGASWTPLMDSEINLNVSALVMKPGNPNTLYAGTGEGFLNADALPGRGVFKTTDGGQTWTRLHVANGLNTSFITELAISPANPSVVYASGRRTYPNNNISAETTPDAGVNAVFKSTNEGQSWTDITTGKVDHDPSASFDNIPTDIAVSPLSPDTLFGAFGFRRSNGIWRTVNGGQTWTRLTSGLPSPASSHFNRIELAMSPSNPRVLYASYSDSASNESLGIWKTTNGGNSWTQVATPQSTAQRNINDGRLTVLGEQGFYNNALAVHPTDPNTVFVGGIDIYRSTNGGSSWTQVSMWIPDTPGFSYAHADNHVFAFFAGTNPPTLYAGNDGGVYRSFNNGTNWGELNNSLGVTQFYFMAAHPDDPDVLLGGSQDNGSPMTISSGIDNWSDITTGDGGPAAFDFNNPSTFYASIYDLNVYRFDGANFATGQIPNPTPIGVNGSNIIDQTDVDGAAFFGPLEMSPNSPSVLALGSHRVLKTTNKGNDWTPISGALSSGLPIISLAIAPGNDNIVWAATRPSGSPSSGSFIPSKIFKTENNGGSWEEVTRSNLPVRFISDIEFQPGSSSIVYLTYSGYGTPHVFKSTNAGASWTDITNNLPDAPVNCIEVHPNNINLLIAGTDIGVFLSVDAGATWQPANNGFPITQVVALNINVSTGRLVAATHGRGMFDAPLSTVSVDETPNAGLPASPVLYSNYPNPFNPSTTIAYELFKSGTVTLKVYDILGRETKTLLQEVKQAAGRREVTFDATGLASGAYFARLTVDDRVVGNQKMTLVR